jgi:hypothetical protein
VSAIPRDFRARSASGRDLREQALDARVDIVADPAHAVEVGLGGVVDCPVAAQYARLRARRGANKATIAVCHSILTAVWHMLSTGETYTDPGGDYFARRDPERTRKRLVGQLERLGYTVTLQEGAATA